MQPAHALPTPPSVLNALLSSPLPLGQGQVSNAKGSFETRHLPHGHHCSPPFGRQALGISQLLVVLQTLHCITLKALKGAAPPAWNPGLPFLPGESDLSFRPCSYLSPNPILLSPENPAPGSSPHMLSPTRTCWTLITCPAQLWLTYRPGVTDCVSLSSTQHAV